MGSRRILGHALGAHHDAALAYGALAMASPSGAVPYPGPAAIISPPGSPTAHHHRVIRDQHRYKASSARAQSRLVASLTRVPVAASRPIARRLDTVLESLAFTAPAGEFPPRTPGPAPYHRCGAPSPADLDQVHRRRRPAQRVLSGLAKAPCRHQVILRIQGTAEQIRARSSHCSRMGDDGFSVAIGKVEGPPRCR